MCNVMFSREIIRSCILFQIKLVMITIENNLENEETLRLFLNFAHISF